MENICDYKNCKKIGKHKAPIEKDNSKKFRWLCLDHIKEFNQRWDYFKGMSDHEIYSFLKSDMTCLKNEKTRQTDLYTRVSLPSYARI